MIRILAVLAAFVFATPAFSQALPAGLDKANAIVIDTTKGRIVIKLRTDIAPPQTAGRRSGPYAVPRANRVRDRPAPKAAVAAPN